MGTAWCVLQASIWSGIQTRNFAASAEASRESNLYQNKANQERLLDAQIYLSLAEAYLTGNEKLVGFYLKRFPAGFRDSLPIWLSPSTPPRFRNLGAIQDSTTKRLEATAAELRDHGEKMRLAAGEANSVSDTYVLVTVLFASTLFCSGLGAKMKTVRVRQYIFVFGAVFVIAAVILLMFLPVSWHWGGGASHEKEHSGIIQEHSGITPPLPLRVTLTSSPEEVRHGAQPAAPS